jgi:protein-cysteine N-palmitoyltransferase HHAT
MTPITFLRQLYSLDTLDTRFASSGHTPLKAADEDPAQALKPQEEKSRVVLPAGASPSRWRTPEFYFYALVFIVVVPQMFKAVVDVSQRKYGLRQDYKSRLSLSGC